MSKVEYIHFHGAKLVTFRDELGVPHVAMKPIVEALGLEWKRQYNKLIAERERLTVVHMYHSSGDGKDREMLSIPVKKLNGWLFGINPNKVRPDLKERLIEFQEECFAALHDYWMHGSAINTRLGLTQASLFDDLPELKDTPHIKLSEAHCRLLQSGIAGHAVSRDWLKKQINRELLRGRKTQRGWYVENASFNEFCAHLKMRI